MLHDLLLAAGNSRSVFPNPIENPATLFVAAGHRGGLVTSPDAINWTARTTYTTENIHSLGFNGSDFMLGEGTGKIKSSSNGTSWAGGFIQSFPSSATYDVNGIAYGNGVWVAVSVNGYITTSVDGVTWTTRNSSTPNHLNSVHFINNKFFATGTSGTIITSLDGINWIVASTPISNGINKIAYGNGVYLAACDLGIVLKSTDGDNWVIATNQLNFNLRAIVFANNGFVIGDSGGAFYKTVNGISFAQQAVYFGGGVRLNDIIHRNNLFIIVGVNGRIQTTVDFTDIIPRASNFSSSYEITSIISN